jgi:hypothetical protein
MERFAHNGVEHTTALESAGHSANSTILTVILITAATILLITTLMFVLKKFSLVKEPVNEEKEQ